MTLNVICAAAALIWSATSALAAQSIVGEWTLPGAGCNPTEGAIVIGAKMIVGDDMRCDFTSVQRTGDVVTWRGTCGFPEPAKAATVVAASSGSTLSLRINGGAPNMYRRCAKSAPRDRARS